MFGMAVKIDSLFLEIENIFLKIATLFCFFVYPIIIKKIIFKSKFTKRCQIAP